MNNQVNKFKDNSSDLEKLKTISTMLKNSISKVRQARAILDADLKKEKDNADLQNR